MNGHEKRTLMKKKDIINATKKLVSTIPLSHIRISDIAQLASVSQVTIYKLYENKQALIKEAIKTISYENVNDVNIILKKDLPYSKRIELFFKTSFNNTIVMPEIAKIREYIFSGVDEDLKSYVTNLYNQTTTLLTQLYYDGLNEHLIRSEINLEMFLSMLDLYSHTHPRYYSTKEKLTILINSLIRSFT